MTEDYKPIGGEVLPPMQEAPRGDFGIDPRSIRPRSPRESRTVPWQGCTLFPADDLAEVPASATLRIRVGLSWDGEEVWFDRKPFPLSLVTADLQKRFGPARYTLALVSVDPTAPGSGLRGPPLATKTLEVRSRGDGDVGEEAWPINTSLPETPRALVEECARRAEYRGDGEAGRGQSRFGGDPRASSAYGSGGFDPRDRDPRDRDPRDRQSDDDDDDDDDPGPAPSGFRWSQYRGRLVLMPTSGDGQLDAGELRFAPGTFGQALAPPPPPPPPPTGLAVLFARPPEELLMFAAGAMKLFKELSGSGERAASVEVERERVKADYELRKQEQAQQHQMFLEQMKLQMAQAAASRPVPQAPLVDEAAIRAAAYNEARLESLKMELERQREEIRAAKQVRSEPQQQPDLMTQIAKIRETAAALGMERKGAGSAAPPAPVQPSGFEQIADMLDTQGGKVLVEKLADRFFGGDTSPQQQAQQVQQQVQHQLAQHQLAQQQHELAQHQLAQQQAQQQQVQQLPPQYGFTPEQPQTYYGGDEPLAEPAE